jgi:hypothetical protein
MDDAYFERESFSRVSRYKSNLVQNICTVPVISQQYKAHDYLVSVPRWGEVSAVVLSHFTFGVG